MFFKLARYALDHSRATLSKLIVPDHSVLVLKIEQLTLENLALLHENRILKRNRKRIAFTRLDKFLLG